MNIDVQKTVTLTADEVQELVVLNAIRNNTDLHDMTSSDVIAYEPDSNGGVRITFRRSE